jgi:hypothetical protein
MSYAHMRSTWEHYAAGKLARELGSVVFMLLRMKGKVGKGVPQYSGGGKEV